MAGLDPNEVQKRLKNILAEQEKKTDETQAKEDVQQKTSTDKPKKRTVSQDKPKERPKEKRKSTQLTETRSVKEEKAEDFKSDKRCKKEKRRPEKGEPEEKSEDEQRSSEEELCEEESRREKDSLDESSSMEDTLANVKQEEEPREPIRLKERPPTESPSDKSPSVQRSDKTKGYGKKGKWKQKGWDKGKTQFHGAMDHEKILREMKRLCNRYQAEWSEIRRNTATWREIGKDGIGVRVVIKKRPRNSKAQVDNNITDWRKYTLILPSVDDQWEVVEADQPSYQDYQEDEEPPLLLVAILVPPWLLKQEEKGPDEEGENLRDKSRHRSGHGYYADQGFGSYGDQTGIMSSASRKKVEAGVSAMFHQDQLMRKEAYMERPPDSSHVQDKRGPNLGGPGKLALLVL